MGNFVTRNNFIRSDYSHFGRTIEMQPWIKNPIIYQLSTLWHNFHFNLYIFQITHQMRFIFGCSGLRQSERDKRPKKLPRHTFVETFPIPTTTNVRLKKPYAQKSISISGHFHHIIFLLHYQKVVGTKSLTLPIVSFRMCKRTKWSAPRADWPENGNATQNMCDKKNLVSYSKWSNLNVGFKCGASGFFPWQWVFRSADAESFKTENVNRHIYFDLEPISYRSYGRNENRIFGQHIHWILSKGNHTNAWFT